VAAAAGAGLAGFKPASWRVTDARPKRWVVLQREHQKPGGCFGQAGGLHRCRRNLLETTDHHNGFRHRPGDAEAAAEAASSICKWRTRSQRKGKPNGCLSCSCCSGCLWSFLRAVLVNLPAWLAVAGVVRCTFLGVLQEQDRQVGAACFERACHTRVNPADLQTRRPKGRAAPAQLPLEGPASLHAGLPPKKKVRLPTAVFLLAADCWMRAAEECSITGQRHPAAGKCRFRGLEKGLHGACGLGR